MYRVWGCVVMVYSVQGLYGDVWGGGDGVQGLEMCGDGVQGLGMRGDGVQGLGMCGDGVQCTGSVVMSGDVW